MALRNCPRITFATADRVERAPLGIFQPTDKATANTRHSTNFSQQEEPASNHIKLKTRKNIFGRHSSIPSVEPLSGLDRIAVKFVTSDEGNEDMKKSQRFFESQKQLRTYASQEKFATRRMARRCKIFEKREGESRVSEVAAAVENANNRGSLPKLSELKNSIYLQKQGELKAGVRIHSTSQTVFNREPIRTASPNRITFSYLSNQPPAFITQQHSHSQMPTDERHFPMSHNTKTSLIRGDRNDVVVRPFISIYNQQEQNGHHNPATAKIKKADSMKMSAIPQDPPKMSWGNRIKTSLIESNRPREEILSKISLNICRESTVRAKQNNQLNDSDLCIAGNERYFDDDEAFPTRNKLSYRNIEIEKQEEEQREEEIAPHNYLFIDFENSRRNDPIKEDSQIHSQKESAPHPAILEQSTLVIGQKNMVARIREAYFPVVLILLAALLLGIQIWA